MAENLTYDVVYSSEIEGVRLNVDEVRSSIARRLGIENVKCTAPSHYVDSVVAVLLEVMRDYNLPLSKKKLCAWQAAFFPSGYSEGAQIEIGKYRTHEEHIVSGMMGRERIHYIAPAPERVEEEMKKFLEWFNGDAEGSSVVRSAIAHLWFVSIHPFEDGNGRLARILSDILLARADKSEFRFYNISSQINKDKNHYYNILEKTQRGDGDITEWIHWYATTLSLALDEAETVASTILNKSFFWQKAATIVMSQRQKNVLNMFMDGYEAKISSKTWASIAKCSKDTAIRDIQDLVGKNILREDIPGAKRPSYSIIYDPENLTMFFADVRIEEQNGSPYLLATYKGKLPVRERILPLDAERFRIPMYKPVDIIMQLSTGKHIKSGTTILICGATGTRKFLYKTPVVLGNTNLLFIFLAIKSTHTSCTLHSFCYFCGIHLRIMAQSVLTIRLDSDLKMQFDSLCEEFGMSTNSAFNIYVRQWSDL